MDGMGGDWRRRPETVGATPQSRSGERRRKRMAVTGQAEVGTDGRSTVLRRAVDALSLVREPVVEDVQSSLARSSPEHRLRRRLLQLRPASPSSSSSARCCLQAFLLTLSSPMALLDEVLLDNLPADAHLKISILSNDLTNPFLSTFGSWHQDSVVPPVDADVEFQLQLDCRRLFKLLTYDVKLMAATRLYDVTNASGQRGWIGNPTQAWSQTNLSSILGQCNSCDLPFYHH